MWLRDVRLVGQYALRFAFDDGHSTGIYPYDALLELCPCDARVAKREQEGVES